MKQRKKGDQRKHLTSDRPNNHDNRGQSYHSGIHSNDFPFSMLNVSAIHYPFIPREAAFNLALTDGIFFCVHAYAII